MDAQLLELIANGENSGVEFKRDDVRPEQIAKEIVALANLQGGRLLPGVEDDGDITGIQQPRSRRDAAGVDLRGVKTQAGVANGARRYRQLVRERTHVR